MNVLSRPRLLLLTIFLSVVTGLFPATSANAQNGFVTFKDSVTGLTVCQGPMTWNELRAQPDSIWLTKGIAEYEPDAAAVDYLKRNLQSVSMLVFLGTWCDDSRFLIPRFAKTLIKSEYQMQNAQLFGVDRNKQTRGDESKTYKVTKAPTIIVMSGNKEIGRIVETVPVSIEKSLMDILKNTGFNK